MPVHWEDVRKPGFHFLLKHLPYFLVGNDKKAVFCVFFAFVELCPAGQGEISREMQESPEIVGVFEDVDIVHIGVEFYGDSVAAKKSGDLALDIFFCRETPGKVPG